jgi:hypothetical protein
MSDEDRFDLRGKTPESHDCVDCGVNTAPGVPNRAELEAAFKSGAESVPYTVTAQCEMYMVRERVWEQAGMAPCRPSPHGNPIDPKGFYEVGFFSRKNLQH